MTTGRGGSDQPHLGAIEAGGTKFICALGAPSGELLAEERIETTTPDETLERVVAFFAPHEARLAAIGIGCFGPIQLDPRRPSYGIITTTPKPNWSHYDIVGAVGRRFPVPIAFDTDVNAAALAEVCWGGAHGMQTFVYVTIGAGVGGGVMVEGALLHGMSHPEIGHMRVPHDRNRDPFDGICPYHRDCLEGLVSGPAIEARWQIPPPALAPDHPAWALEAEYLAVACVNLACCFSPQRIVLGGGVAQPHLFPRVRKRFIELLNGYMVLPRMLDVDSFIVPASLGGRAGVRGALALAARQLGLRAVGSSG